MDETLVILLIIVGAFIAPLIARLIHIPVAVAEIGYGILIGNIFGYKGSEIYIIEFLSEFGFLLLMFLAGLEIDFNLIERLPPKKLIFFFFYPPTITITSVILFYYMGKQIITGMLISVIAIGLSFTLLKELNIINTDIGKNLIIIGGIGEIWSLLILTFADIYGIHGLNMDAILSFSKIVFLFISLMFLFHILRLAVWWYPEVFQRIMYEKDPSAVGIRISLVLMFSFSLLVKLVGMESILGAFIGGILISYFLRKKGDLVSKLSAFGYGFLIPIFFINFGMGIDLNNFMKISTIIEGIMLTFAIFFVRFLTIPYMKLLAIDIKKGTFIILSLSFPFTLLIVGSEIAYYTGAISEQTKVSLILSAILSSIAFPWATKLYAKSDKALGIKD